MVPKTHLLAGPRDGGHAGVVSSKNLGSATYIGPGAGRYPTANSVVADIMRIATGRQPDPFPEAKAPPATKNSFDSAFYIRVSISDGIGIIASVGAAAEKNGVSINSVLQNPIVNREACEFCITTEITSLSAVEALCGEIEKISVVKGAPFFMPMLE